MQIRGRVAGLLILVIMTLGTISQSWGQSPAGDPRAAARQLLESGQAVDAAFLYEQIVAASPEDAEARLLLGIAYFKAGRAEDAAEAFQAAIALDPQNWRPHYNLGAAYFEMARWNDAVAAFLALPILNPDLTDAAFLNAGLARYQQGDVDGARLLFNRAVTTRPDGTSATQARQMLARLDAASADLANAKPAKAAVRTAKPWTMRLSVGRQYDSNVRLRPDDVASPNISDWRNLLRLRSDYRMPLSSRYQLTGIYDFFGRWYDSENTRDYQFHRLILRADDRESALRPRLEYRFEMARLGGSGFLNAHRLATRVRVMRQQQRALYAGAHITVSEAPGSEYDYLSGNEYGVDAIALMPFSALGRLRGNLALRYVDANDRLFVDANGANNFDSYSYSAIETKLRVTHPLMWRLEGAAGARYQYRRYQDDDFWGGPTPGSKRRTDHRFGINLAVTRVLTEQVDLELSYRGQFNYSNLGNDVIDDRDRDYQRNLIGLNLKAVL